MANLGSKALRRKPLKTANSDTEMAEADNLLRKGRKKDMSKKPRKGNLDNESASKKHKGGKKNRHEKVTKRNRNADKDKKSKNDARGKSGNSSEQKIVLRKSVDPETAKYFNDIARLFEGNEVELEDRSAICGNAIEETRGKEVELATDHIISYTLETLLEGCELEQLCGFLQNCAEGFSLIAMDKFGSHVVETALKSLSANLHDEESRTMIEDTLNRICQMVVRDTVDIMRSPYGSHVLRSLLCLFKGVPLDTLEQFHVTKPSTLLAERLNCSVAKSHEHHTDDHQHSFPDLFSFLIKGMLEHAQKEMATLRVNKYSCFVLQTALKLLVGDDEELLHAILIIIGSMEDDVTEEKFIKAEMKPEIISLLEDTAFSHLFEVIIEVAPVPVFDEFLNEVFKGSLFETSSLQCGNFVVQALVASAKTKDQVKLIWEELGSKLKEILEIGKSGVVASILATCQRLQINVHECCQALAAAVSSGSDSSKCIVPHLMFLENYFRQKSSWMWPVGDKMHTLGCLMLQIIFRCPKQYVQAYINSISSMDADHIYETAKDAGGSRVLETFLCSEASVKHKFEIISKLQNYFGQLAMHPSSSFTVEKCFAASNVSLKEAIALELLTVQADLSKTKHGPYLLKKLDIDGFARRPEQWKRSQASKETIYREFHSTFGSNTQLQENPESSKNLSKKRKEKIDNSNMPNSTPSVDSEFTGLEASMGKLGFLSGKRGVKRDKPDSATKSNVFVKKPFLRISKKTTNTPLVRDSGKRKSPGSELADLAGKKTLSSGDVHKLFRSSAFDEIKQYGKEKKPFLEKQRR